MSKEIIFYRYHDEPLYEGHIEIRLSKFCLLRETPCGYWIIPDYISNYLTHNTKFSEGMVDRSKRWVSKTTRKRYAYPTKAEALQNLIARKSRQAMYSRYYLDRSKKALSMAESMLKKESEAAA